MAEEKEQRTVWTKQTFFAYHRVVFGFNDAELEKKWQALLKPQDLTDFDNWFNEFRWLMVKDYGFPPGKPDSFYGDKESRRDLFESGLTPDEAIREELEDAER